MLSSALFERQAFQFMRLSLLVNMYNQLCLNKNTTRVFPLVYACLFLLKGLGGIAGENQLPPSSGPFKISEYLSCIILPHPMLYSSVSHCPCQMDLKSCLILLPCSVSSLEREMACFLFLSSPVYPVTLVSSCYFIMACLM